MSHKPKVGDIYYWTSDGHPEDGRRAIVEAVEADETCTIFCPEFISPKTGKVYREWREHKRMIGFAGGFQHASDIYGTTAMQGGLDYLTAITAEDL